MYRRWKLAIILLAVVYFPVCKPIYSRHVIENKTELPLHIMIKSPYAPDKIGYKSGILKAGYCLSINLPVESEMFIGKQAHKVSLLYSYYSLNMFNKGLSVRYSSELPDKIKKKIRSFIKTKQP